MKKMKFVTKGLALLMMGAMLAGCSDKATESSEDKTREKVESSIDESTDESNVEESSSVESSVEESSSVDDVVVESTSIEESVTESTSEEQNNGIGTEVEVGSADKNELLAKYKDYFTNYSMDKIKLSMEMTGESMGEMLTINMDVSIWEGSTYLYLGVPASKSSLEIYVMSDSNAYLAMKYAGQEPLYYKTSGLDQETADDMNIAGELVGATSNANFDLEYVRAEEIDGVLYDVLKSNDTSAAQELFIYMNRETGTLAKMYANESGMEMKVDIKEITSPITVSDEFAKAQEIDAESFSMNMIFGMAGLTTGASLD